MTEEKVLELMRRELDRRSQDARYTTLNETYHLHNGIDSPVLPLTNIGGVPNSYTGQKGNVLLVNNNETGMEFFSGYFAVAKDTNGTSNVNVFGASGAPFAMTVTAVYLIAKDTTAANISLSQASNTVCTFAKGIVANIMLGAASLANTTYAKGDACQIVSSTAGNATVIIVFTT